MLLRRPAARFAPWLLMLVPLASVGCGDDQGAMPTMVECQVDSDCSDPSRPACRAAVCVDAGCPTGSIYVPAGSFGRGCQSTDPDCDPSAQPASLVSLSRGFCLDESERTVGDYRACLSSGRCAAPTAPETLDSLRCSTDRATFTSAVGANEALPMSCLLWAEASALCSARGGRLPTEAEWERAARGDDSRPFPWGRAAPVACDQGVNFAGSDCSGLPWSTVSSGAAGFMARGPYGHRDLGGNLSEWVADFFASDGYTSCASGCSDPSGPTSGLLRARRGGSFASRLPELRSYARDFQPPGGPRSDLIGARCAYPSAR